MAIVHFKIRQSLHTIINHINVCYQQTGGPLNEFTARNATAAAAGPWQQFLGDFFSHDMRVESFHARVIDAGPFPTNLAETQDTKGAKLVNAVAAITPLIVNLRNSAGLLKRPGRWNISGFPSPDTNNGAVDTNTKQALETFIEDNLLTISSAAPNEFAGQLVVAQRSGGNGQPVVWTPVLVDRVDVSSVLGSRITRKGRLQSIGERATPTP